MFRLINKDDSKVFSCSMFIKNADFFKDEIAFFDAFSNLCEKNINEIPNYCAYHSGKFCLEGVCLFFKTYASELGFKTIDLSIGYLKVLYYAIAAHSKDGETVDKDMVLNEYLVYKDANEKQVAAINDKLIRTEKAYGETKSKFEQKNDRYAKLFVTAKVLSIVSTIVVILSFISAMIPVALYYAEKIAFRKMLFIAVGVLMIGLILKFEFKMISKYLAELAMDEAYALQSLKKNKDETFVILSGIKIKNSKILCEYYEYLKGLDDNIFETRHGFDEILRLAVKNNIMSFNIMADVLKIDENHQKEVYSILDRLANVEVSDIGRLENIYRDIENKDYLKYNNLVKFSFLTRFIENAHESKHWRLDFGTVKTNPFDVNVKEIAEAQIAYLPSEHEMMISSRLNIFFGTKYAKKHKYLQLKNIKNETGFYLSKVEYINHFYDYSKLKASVEDVFDNRAENQLKPYEELRQEARQIPAFVNLKLALIKNRLICNTLGEQEFLKIKNIVSVYEKTQDASFEKLNAKSWISEHTEENKNFIHTLFGCTVKDIGNGEVLCMFGDQQIRGYKLANI